MDEGGEGMEQGARDGEDVVTELTNPERLVVAQKPCTYHDHSEDFTNHTHTHTISIPNLSGPVSHMHFVASDYQIV